MKLGRAWEVARCAVDWVKTLAVFVVVSALGLADYFDAVNLKPVFDYVLGDDKSTKLMVFLPVLFSTLRFLTKGNPPWMRRRWHEREEGNCDKGRC